MNNPSVTVIIPTLNRPTLLRRCLASVTAQTFVDYEVIVVDDGSEPPVEPDSMETRVRVLRHRRRRGAGAARNTGLAAARSPFIAFLDDDDEWHPEKLSCQVDALCAAGPDAALTYCGYELVVTATGAVIESFMPNRVPLELSDFFRRTFFGCSMPLIKAGSLRAIGGFDTQLGGMQDRDLWLRLAVRGRFVPVARILVRCHVHGPSISTDVHGKVIAKRDFWTKHADLLSVDPIACARHWRRLAMLHFAAGEGQAGRACLHVAHRWASQGWTRYVHLIASRVCPRAHARYVERSVFCGIDGLRWYA